MNACFADTSYYIALINPADDAFKVATEFTSQFTGRIVTSSAVINELGNYLCAPMNRRLFIDLIHDLRSDPDISIVHVHENLFNSGIEMYSRWPDHEWSLTDCISFVIMEERDLKAALTTDRHFQ
jgi:predicted nucleic acid-binding protein